MTGADHRGDDGFHLLAQAAFEGRFAVVGADAGLRIVGRGAIGQQFAGLVDYRNALGLHAVDRGRDQVADGADLLRLQRAAHFQYD